MRAAAGAAPGNFATTVSPCETVLAFLKPQSALRGCLDISRFIQTVLEYVCMCLAPSFLPSPAVRVTRITESKRRRMAPSLPKPRTGGALVHALVPERGSFASCRRRRRVSAPPATAVEGGSSQAEGSVDIMKIIMISKAMIFMMSHRLSWEIYTIFS